MKNSVVKDVVFISPPSLSLSPLSAGLAGFFPLHPMTITEAERQKAQTVLTETAPETQDGLEEGQKEMEV